MRTYLAIADDGHDYLEFEFESEHRLNSADNLTDAKRTLRRRYGRHISNISHIKDVMRCE